MSDLYTPQTPWIPIRALAAENEAAVINWAGPPTGLNYFEQRANCIDIRSKFGRKFAGLLLAFYGGTVGLNDVVGGTDKFGFDLLAYRDVTGRTDGKDTINPPLLICTAIDQAAEVGTLEMTPDGGTTVTSMWTSTIALTNKNKLFNIATFDNGNNRVCIVALDFSGCRYLFPRIMGADGAVAGEAPGVGIVAAAF